MAGFWSRSRRVRSREFLFDPRLQLLERREGLLELAQLGVRGPLVGSTEEAERLQPVDGGGGKSIAGAPLCLRLAEPPADPLGQRREPRRLARKRRSVNGQLRL